MYILYVYMYVCMYRGPQDKAIDMILLVDKDEQNIIEVGQSVITISYGKVSALSCKKNTKDKAETFVNRY